MNLGYSHRSQQQLCATLLYEIIVKWKKNKQEHQQQTYLNEEECLEEEVKEHVGDDLTDAGKRLRFTSRHFKCQVSYVLQHRI